jgi:hypothetical protein
MDPWDILLLKKIIQELDKKGLIVSIEIHNAQTAPLNSCMQTKSQAPKDNLWILVSTTSLFAYVKEFYSQLAMLKS